MQKLLSLIITVAILYMVIKTRMEDNKPQGHEQPTANHTVQKDIPSTEAKTQQQGTFVEKALSNVLINVLKTEQGRMFFENILQPMNRPLAGANEGLKINNTNFINSLFKITTIGDGTIGPASCGHIVTIFYQLIGPYDELVEEQTKTFTLGTKKIMPGLDSIIVGMKVGQTRQAVIPPPYAFMNAKNVKPGIDPQSYYKVSVTLKQILPHNFADPLEVKIYDDEVAYKMPLLCGDRVSFDAKIIKLADGKVIFDSSKDNQKIQITIGDINYPMIFSHSLFGKIPTGTRTVIARGKLFKSFANKESNKIFPKAQLAQEEYFMLDLNNFQLIENITNEQQTNLSNNNL